MADEMVACRSGLRFKVCWLGDWEFVFLCVCIGVTVLSRVLVGVGLGVAGKGVYRI